MFKNIEISEINRRAVLDSAWAEFGAFCVIGYLTILCHLLKNQNQSMPNSTLDTVFIGLFVTAWFLYVSFFYWGLIWALDWILERFFITNTANERRVYILFGIEMLFAALVIFLTRTYMPISDYWHYFITMLFCAKLFRIYYIKRKNKLINQI